MRLLPEFEFKLSRPHPVMPVVMPQSGRAMSDDASPYDTPGTMPDEIRPKTMAARTAARLFAVILIGTVIGGLVAMLGGYQYRLYVRTFQPNSGLHTTLADFANTIRPVAWFFPMIFGVYQCVRSKVSFDYVLLFGLIGGGFGWMSSGYVMANPGPNYHESIYNAPIGCFVGTILGAVIQTFRWPPHKEA